MALRAPGTTIRIVARQRGARREQRWRSFSRKDSAARIFSLSKHVAILELVPANLPGKRHVMPDKTPGDGIGCAVIE
jgi:hypothetical protein